MLAAHLVEPRPGETVLDLCAAPGGKTTHLAELAGGQARVVAADADWARLHRVLENIERLESPGISVVCADGVRPPFRTGFDRVLADAPCSGLGTLRRHPDIKWRMSPEAISRLAELQVSLLRSAVQLCKNGGLVVYSVCTFSKQETQDVVQTVCHDGQVELEDGPEWLQPWKIAKGQYRMLPSAEAWDGFFLTRFRKAS
jgi:16S rRNA (cytosine967-C5)-methyltransferase